MFRWVSNGDGIGKSGDRMEKNTSCVRIPRLH